MSPNAADLTNSSREEQTQVPSQRHIMTGRLASTGVEADDRFPDIDDLAERLRFSFKEGRVWLDTERVTLIHLSTLTALRSELIDSVGNSKARGLLTRMGWGGGARDAALARKLKPQHSVIDALRIGPQLRNLQGVASPQSVRLEADVSAGTYYGEFIWSESFEVDAHVSNYGMSDRPVCWLQLGYFGGYTSSFMGRTILFREVECRATGHAHCRIIGKPVEEWEGLADALEEDLDGLQPESFVNRFEERQLGLHTPDGTAPARTGDLADLPRGLVGASSAFVAACHKLKKVARTSATVLFQGETGVGKEVFAKTVHQISRRADAPFVAVNCSAIPENLIEAELFGVVKGAFTGSVASRPGRFERADGGTLFLDEVGSLTQAAQIKLLRAIQEREIERVGDTRARQVDVRIVAATNVDLREAVKEGAFRMDLLYRLDVFPLHLPPLRERRDDIPLLMNHFFHRYTKLHGKDVTGFTQRAVDGLYEYDYPGNVRELENLIERAVILCDDSAPIDLVHLFSSEELLLPVMLKLDRHGGVGMEPRARTLSEDVLEDLLDNGVPLAEIEQKMIARTVAQAGGNLSEAARRLGITRPQLAYRLEKGGRNSD